MYIYNIYIYIQTLDPNAGQQAWIGLGEAKPAEARASLMRLEHVACEEDLPKG